MSSATYRVEAMDCGAEEQLVRMRLAGIEGIASVQADASTRTVVVTHDIDTAMIDAALESLGLGSSRTGETDEARPTVSVGDERSALLIALGLNLAMLFGEGIAGWLANSLGLLADALDMGADAAVYGLSLAAVGGTARRKGSLARLSGYLQLGLAVLGLAEVVRRVVTDQPLPDATTMVAVSAIALLANVATLVVLRRARSGEVHIEASWIFTANDVKINALVIATSLAVGSTQSRYPDLVVGGIIFAIAANASRRILRLANTSSSAASATSWLALPASWRALVLVRVLRR